MIKEKLSRKGIGGRKAISANSQRGKELINKAFPFAVRKLIELTRSDDANVALRAAIEVVRQRIGNPPQRIELDAQVAHNFLIIFREEVAKLPSVSEGKPERFARLVQSELLSSEETIIE